MKARMIYAATGTPIIKTSTGIKVVMAQRVKSSSFFPGFHVFPGGAVDPKDIELASAFSQVSTSVEGDIPEIAYRIAVVREYFEEMGVLLTRRGALRTDLSESLRTKLLNAETNFLEVLDKIRVSVRELPIEEMIYAGTQITPPFSSRIYVARYYFLSWKRQHELFPHAKEYLRARWISPQNILHEFDQLEARIPPPVLHVLRMLASKPHDITAKQLARERDIPHGIDFPIEFAPHYEVIPFLSDTIPPAIATNLVCIGGKEYYMVDPGAGTIEAKKHLIEVLQHKKIQGKELVGIILTHHHKDHFEAVPAILEQFQVPVYAHEHTIRKLEDQGLEIKKSPSELQMATEQGGLDRLQIIHTPGHTKGSITVYHPRSRIAAVGDLMAGIGTVVINPPEGNLLEYLNSLNRLLGLDLRMIVPGHGPLLFSPQKALRDYITHRTQRHKTIEQAIKQGAKRIMDIVKYVYKDEIPSKLYPLAARSVLAHLYALMEEEKLTEKQFGQLIIGYELEKFPSLETLK